MFCKAVSSLNTELTQILQNSNGSDPPSLRPIMRKYNNLRKICVLLDKSYRFQMLSSLCGVFLECITVVKQFTEDPEKVYCIASLIWGACHFVGLSWVMHHCQQAEDMVGKTPARHFWPSYTSLVFLFLYIIH